MNNIKHSCYVVLRQDLEMPLGKFSVQVGHAVDQIWGYYMQNSEYYRTTDDEDIMSTVLSFQGWHKEGRRKIVLKAKDLSHLSKIEDKLKEENAKVLEIKDLGFNFFEGETVTGLVVYPTSSQLKALKRLQCW